MAAAREKSTALADALESRDRARAQVDAAEAAVERTRHEAAAQAAKLRRRGSFTAFIFPGCMTGNKAPILYKLQMPRSVYK